MSWRNFILLLLLIITDTVSGSRGNPWSVDLYRIDDTLFNTEEEYEKQSLIQKATLDGMFAIPLLEKAALSNDKILQRIAMEALYKLGPVAKLAEPTLIKHCSHPDKTIRGWALHALVRINSMGVDAVVNALTSEDNETQRLAIEALKEKFKYNLADQFSYFIQELALRKEQGIVKKLEALLDHSHYSVAQAAASWLTEFGPQAKSAMLSLVDALKSKHIGVRTNAARAIGEMGEIAHSTKSDLQRLLTHHEHVEDRASAALALIKIGYYQEGMAPLLADLKHANNAVRHRTLEKLLELVKVDANFVKGFSRYFLHEVDLSNLVLAIKLVEKLDLRDKRITDRLWDMARSGNGYTEVHSASVDALATVDNQNAEIFSVLKNSLTAQNKTAYIQLMKTYWKLSRSDAKPFIRALLPYLQYDQPMRSAALKVLNNLSEDAGFALPYLVRILVIQEIRNEEDRLFYLGTAALIIKLQTKRWSKLHRLIARR